MQGSNFSPSSFTPPTDAGRIFLIIATFALVVARPLVSGEDPALSSTVTDPSGITLTLMWFLLASAWSLWAFLSKVRVLPFGIIEVGLILLAGVYFISAELVARNQYAASLFSWEMLGMVCCFFAIRQATLYDREQKALWNVLLATAFSVVVYGLYQYAWEMPSLREQYGNNIEKLKQDFIGQTSGSIDPDSLFLDQLRQRVMQTHIYSTYSHPNSLASFLALTVPGALGLVVASWFGVRRWLLFPLAMGIALAFLIALWANFSRGAIASIAFVLVLSFCLYLWRTFPKKRTWLILSFVFLFASGFLLSKTNLLEGIFKKESSSGLSARVDYWNATWRMIEKQPLLGVGPGNFANTYPQFMNEKAEEKIKDPHNFILELWSSAGIAAPILFILIIISLFRRFIKNDTSENAEVYAGEPLPPWITYLGGMLGLLLAFVLRIEYRPPSDLIQESIGALLRTAGWFIALGVLENIHLSKGFRTQVLFAGIGAMLLNLSVSGSLAFAAVMVPFWVVVALAWNSSEAFSLPFIKRGLKPAWACTIIIGITAVFMVSIFFPLANAYTLATRAIQNAHLISAEPFAKNNGAKLERLRKNVLEPLQQAVALEPSNSRWHLMLATWYPAAFLEASKIGDGQSLSYGNAALQELDRTAKFNPDSIETVLLRTQIRSLYAERNKAQAYNQYLDAAQALRNALPIDPFEVKLHFHLAETLNKAYRLEPNRTDSRDFRRESLLQAMESFRLDKLFSNSSRSLTERQRTLLNSIINDKE